MKMVMAIVPRDEVERVLGALVSAGFAATFTDSRGGMLRQAQKMLFIAVEDQDLERVLTIIRESCHSHVRVEPSEAEDQALSPQTAPATAELGGAAVFVWGLDRFEIY